MKSSPRYKVVAALKKLLGDNWFVRTTEEFDGRKGGIWTTNETWAAALGGRVIYDPMAYQTTTTHPKVNALLKKHGWFAEPYDSGTLMLYPI